MTDEVLEEFMASDPHAGRMRPFREMNESGEKTSWDKRYDVIKTQFPDPKTFDWRKAFDKDLDLFARIMRDVLKVDQAVPGRPGPRPALDYDRGVKSLRQMMGQDYSTLPFPDTFQFLAGDRSLSHTARKTGLSRSQVHRLLRGESQPDVNEMTMVAEAFGKHPSFFLEYRAAFVVAALSEKLLNAPEATIGFYRRIQDER